MFNQADSGFFNAKAFFMKEKIIAPRLRPGNKIAVIAPSRSFSILSAEVIAQANQRFKEMGLTIEFGKNIKEIDALASSCIESRLEDLHWAFQEPSIKAIFTVIGGFNSNQLLKYIDWELIKNNPKIFCGYSDITALQNAIFTKTGLVTYSGPHYSSFGQQLNFDYTLDYCKRCLFSTESFDVKPSSHWSDDAWYINQQDCTLLNNEGFYPLSHGQASGTIIGGNLATLQTLQGTEYFTYAPNTILFLEDDGESLPHHIDRNLQALVLNKEFRQVKGIIFGRFQKASGMTKELLHKIVTTKKELNGLPIIANVDFGHTSPMITFPVGGEVYIKASNDETKIIITEH